MENKIEISAVDKKLWPKQNHMSNYGHFLYILASYETKNGRSMGNTSHGSPELILIFLESVEAGEWE